MKKSIKVKNWKELCEQVAVNFDIQTLTRDIVYAASEKEFASFVAWERLGGFYVDTKDTTLCGTGAYYKTLADYRKWERKALANNCKIVRVGF